MASVTPTLGRQADTLDVHVVGQFTNFVQGTTTAHFGDGVAVNSVVVANATSATVNITVGAAAAVGSRTIVMTTGTEVASKVGGFTVEPGVPALHAIDPAAGSEGQNLTIALTGRFTNFAQGLTTASFGPGISVGTVTVNGPALASVAVTINARATFWASARLRSPPDRGGLAREWFHCHRRYSAITVIAPNTGRTDQSVNVGVTGQSTNFQNGVTVASFGPGIYCRRRSRRCTRSGQRHEPDHVHGKSCDQCHSVTR